ncbi:hypothetical protein PsorP6_002814 [Peronosclerospora sorghi]|uniref:Uncharacterized protein n=1 Tax=Peronosclerospora sorghi TaxID=230839 RepID=A0ACC0VM96_9STRA|nr:hypothetical protein PsorP6_002814 [Peronosclerospora sorghi]
MKQAVVASSAIPSEPEPPLDTWIGTDTIEKKKKERRSSDLETNEEKEMEHERKHDEGDNQEKAQVAATEDDAGHSSVQQSSSLNTIKASGTRAVGSFFSRLKVGRKKALSSPKESTAEKVSSSSKNKIQRVKEMDAMDVPKLINTDDKVQTAGLSAEEDTSYVLQEQTKKDKGEDFEEREKVQDSTAEPVAFDDSTMTESTGVDSNHDILTEVTKEAVETGTTTIKNMVLVDKTAVSTLKMLSEDVPITKVTNEPPNGRTSSTQDDQVSLVAPMDLTTEDHHTLNTESIPLEVGLDCAPDIESAGTTHSETKVDSFENTSLELREVSPDVLRSEAKTAESNDISQKDNAFTDETIAVRSSVTKSLVNNLPTNETVQSDAAVVNKAALVKVKVNDFVEVTTSTQIGQSKPNLLGESESLIKTTSSTSQLPVEGAAIAGPEKMSPVKSLANQFESKRKQDLDSLKFRTVREFFPEKRSIDVGAERKKYEAQVQQQQKSNSKTQEEAKSKSKPGLNPEASEEETKSDAISCKSIVEKAAISGERTTDLVDVTTPNDASSRQMVDLDKVAVASDSSGKTSDDAQRAMTPVKSIASRFEGKHEQSLDTLKFRTLRDFFPEKQSARVGSEKQKFEAQTQPDYSLDNLKFRTVRDFFTDEGMRSVRVGAEKAKFEALTRQQEETTKIAEQVNQKNAEFLHTPTSLDGQKSEIALSTDTSAEALLPGLDDPQTLHGSSARNLGAASEVENPITGAVVESIGADMENAVKADESVSKNILASTGIECVREGTSAVLDDQHDAREIESDGTDPIHVDDRKIELSEEAREVTQLEQESDKSVLDLDQCLVKSDHDNCNEHADPDNQAGLCIEQSGKSDDAQDIEVKCDSGLSTQDLGEAIVETPIQQRGGAISDGDIDEKVMVVNAVDSSNSAQVGKNEGVCDEVVECEHAEDRHCDSFNDFAPDAVMECGEQKSMDIQYQDFDTDPRVQVPQCVWSGENGLSSFDPEKAVEAQKILSERMKSNLPPILTTERSIVMEDDNTIETEVTVVVGERSMTDGEDESYLDREALSPTNVSLAHVFSGPTLELEATTSKNPSTKALSAKSVMCASTKPTVLDPTRRVRSAARKAADPEMMDKALPQVKERKSTSKYKDTRSANRSVRSTSTASVQPTHTKQASITAPAPRVKTVSDRAHAPSGLTTHEKQTKNVVGFVEPTPPLEAVASKWASTEVPPLSLMAKRDGEQSVASTVPIRNKKYLNVKSKVLDGIQSGSIHAVPHKTITKEDFIAAERRKSLGLTELQSILNPADRRASLAARTSIDAPPEPFVRSALSRKKLNSTAPRYLNYENSPGYAERARQQYERRKRLEEENAAKSEKRQRELRTFFADKQEKALASYADEVRRGLEAHEFLKLAKENTSADPKTLKAEKLHTRLSHSDKRAPSTSSAGSSTCVRSRTSKKSSVSSVEKVGAAAPLDEHIVGTEDTGYSLLVTEAAVDSLHGMTGTDQLIPVSDEASTVEKNKRS